MAEDLFRHLIVPRTAVRIPDVSQVLLLSSNDHLSTLANTNVTKKPALGCTNSIVSPERESRYFSQAGQGRKGEWASDLEPEDGEITETETSHPMATHRSSATDPNDPSHTHNAAAIKSLPDGTTVTTQRPRNKICFVWYHGKVCDRDPANPKKPGKLCPYLHALNVGEQNIEISSFPPGIGRYLHKGGPRGLELCSWRDKILWSKGFKEKQEKPLVSKAQTADKDSQEMLSSATVRDAHETNKRKACVRHRDDPASLAAKRQKIDYDEQPEYPHSSQKLEETCFFWYHGRCSRSLGPRNNYRCDYKHELTNPPTMVRPPPEYVHYAPCGLEWCPGDGGKPTKAVKERIKSGSGSSCGPAKDRSIGNRRVERSDLEQGASVAGDKHEASSNGQNAHQPCFFWYHGTCRRIQDARHNFKCTHKHELDNPPTMVQPPPGFVHKEPCALEWCPGDASQQNNNIGRYIQDEEGEMEVAKEDRHKYEGSGGGSNGHPAVDESVLEREERYLDGFENTE